MSLPPPHHQPSSSTTAPLHPQLRPELQAEHTTALGTATPPSPTSSAVAAVLAEGFAPSTAPPPTDMPASTSESEAHTNLRESLKIALRDVRKLYDDGLVDGNEFKDLKAHELSKYKRHLATLAANPDSQPTPPSELTSPQQHQRQEKQQQSLPPLQSHLPPQVPLPSLSSQHHKLQHPSSSTTHNLPNSSAPISSYLNYSKMPLVSETGHVGNGPTSATVNDDNIGNTSAQLINYYNTPNAHINPHPAAANPLIKYPPSSSASPSPSPSPPPRHSAALPLPLSSPQRPYPYSQQPEYQQQQNQQYISHSQSNSQSNSQSHSNPSPSPTPNPIIQNHHHQVPASPIRTPAATPYTTPLSTPQNARQQRYLHTPSRPDQETSVTRLPVTPNSAPPRTTNHSYLDINSYRRLMTPPIFRRRANHYKRRIFVPKADIEEIKAMHEGDIPPPS